MASILGTVNDCCSQCCEVNIVDLPTEGTGGGTFSYDTIAVLRQESRVTVLVDGTPAFVFSLLARGDGLGGGNFYFDGASTDLDDGISTVKPDSYAVGDSGRWKKYMG